MQVNPKQSAIPQKPARTFLKKVLPRIFSNAIQLVRKNAS